MRRQRAWQEKRAAKAAYEAEVQRKKAEETKEMNKRVRHNHKPDLNVGDLI